MKKVVIKILSIISALAITITACLIGATVNGENSENTQTAYETLLAEEGFIYGVNLPWFGTSDTRTRTFGEDAFNGMASSYNHNWVEQALTNIKAIGFSSVRTWVFTGWNGIKLDSNGHAISLTDEFKANFEDYLKTVKKVGLTLNAVLVPHFYQSADDVNLASQIVVNPVATQSYIDNALNPLLELMKPYEDSVIALDLYCEPEADTQEKAMMTQGTSMEVIRTFISAQAKAVKKVFPNMPILVSAGQNHVVSEYNDLDLDIMGVDTYNNQGKTESIKEMNTVYPMWVTECGAKTDTGTTDDFNLNSVLSFYESARNSGYKACYYWHYTGGLELSLTKAVDPSYLRMSAVSLHFVILNHKYEREGIDPESVADKPAMLYSTTSDTVKWIGIRDAESYKLEMKIDVGEWETVDVFANDEVDNGFGACSYTFAEMEKTGMYSFRVTGTNYYGLSAVSDVVTYKVIGLSSVTCSPENNLMLNHSFEDGVDSETNAPIGWQTNHAEPKKFFTEIFHVESGSREAGTVYKGENAVHMYGGRSGKVFFQNVNVKKNTDHTFTFFAKSVEYRSSNPVFKIIGVDSAGKWNTQLTDQISFKNYPEEEGEETKWTLYTLRFDSKDFEKVCVYIYDGGAEIYLDDFYLFETPPLSAEE